MLPGMRAFLLQALILASTLAPAGAAFGDALDAASPEAKRHALAAEAAAASGRGAEALQESAAAIALGLDTAALRQVRARSLVESGHYQEALGEAERALALNADSAQGRAWRGRALLGLRRDAEGLDDLRRAAAMDRSLEPEYRLEQARRAPARGRRWPWAAGALAALGALAAAGRRRRWRGARQVRFGSLIPEPSSSGELREGAVLGGRYIVGRPLERGGWGQSFEGRDLEDRPVELLRYAAGGGRRFSLAQAQAAVALAHPGLEPLLAAFEDAGRGVAVRAPAPPEAITLAAALERAPGRRLAPGTALAGVAPVCGALDAAHGAGLAHGAVAPRCLLTGPGGGWTLRGLGLPETPAAESEPPEGAGAPEADLYALACCLYEALAGGRPFAGEGAAAARREGRPAPVAPSLRLPAGLDAFFARALQADPARRFKTGAELLLALRSVIAPAVH